MPIGRPSSAPVLAPLAYFASALAASFIASSKCVKVKQLIDDLVASARRMVACINSTGESFFALNSRSASWAGT
ncbi:hypothetical protein ACVINZ_000321 [Mesorhizobium jarvisii]